MYSLQMLTVMKLANGDASRRNQEKNYFHKQIKNLYNLAFWLSTPSDFWEFASKVSVPELTLCHAWHKTPISPFLFCVCLNTLTILNSLGLIIRIPFLLSSPQIIQVIVSSNFQPILHYFLLHFCCVNTFIHFFLELFGK